MILLDSSGLLALLDRGEPDHQRVGSVLQRYPGPYMILDFVIAEVDFLVLKRLGAAAEKRFVEQLVQGTYLREPVTAEDLATADTILAKYSDQAFGLTDATTMAVATRLGVPVLTLDRRHFPLFRDDAGLALQLLP